MSILATMTRGSILDPEPQASGEADRRKYLPGSEATLTDPQRQAYHKSASNCCAADVLARHTCIARLINWAAGTNP